MIYEKGKKLPFPPFLQIQNITNYAMQTLMAAGVELVPFDSQALNDVSADAWGDNTESYAFEDTDTLAR